MATHEPFIVQVSRSEVPGEVDPCPRCGNPSGSCIGALSCGGATGFDRWMAATLCYLGSRLSDIEERLDDQARRG